MNKTERDIIEESLLNNFPNIIKPLEYGDIETINKYKDGSFGFSYLGIMLYANGCNKKGKSTLYPQGLIYNDGDTVFGIGFFKKDVSEYAGHLHIVAPRGNDWHKAVNNFINKVRSLNQIPKTSIYVRHLSAQQYQELMNSDDFESISSDPWHASAPSEDETYNYRFIKIDDLITYGQTESLEVRTLSTSGSRGFRKKVKMAYNRFKNFLIRNHLSYMIEIYEPTKHQELAKNMVIEHFRTLKQAVGSTPQDYFNLVNFFPERFTDGFVGYIGFLEGNCIKIPVAFFMGEKINKETVAFYATFALRNEPSINVKFNPMGFTAISQYSYIRIFDLVKKKGIQYVDLGGSEIEDLNNFKRQLGANEIRTYWVVKE